MTLKEGYALGVCVLSLQCSYDSSHSALWLAGPADVAPRTDLFPIVFRKSPLRVPSVFTRTDDDCQTRSLVKGGGGFVVVCIA